MRGRKPTPTELKLRRGNPSRRPVNLHEPKHPTIDPAVPDELMHPKARAEWERIISTLSTGHITTPDRAVLIAYCMKWAQWQTYEAELAADKPIILAPSGYPVPNPLVGMANQAYQLMFRAAVELGLTPSARTRVVVATHTPAETDAFAAYQKRRGAA
jgi:P27 family predicted phage terminase small subunit